jgi:hypothetical protein
LENAQVVGQGEFFYGRSGEELFSAYGLVFLGDDGIHRKGRFGAEHAE